MLPQSSTPVKMDEDPDAQEAGFSLDKHYWPDLAAMNASVKRRKPKHLPRERDRMEKMQLQASIEQASHAAGHSADLGVGRSSAGGIALIYAEMEAPSPSIVVGAVPSPDSGTVTSSTGEMAALHAEMEAPSDPSLAAEEVPSTNPGVTSSTGEMAAVHAEMDPEAPSSAVDQTILADEGPRNVKPSQADLSERSYTYHLAERPLTAEAIHSASDSIDDLNLDRSSSAHGDTNFNSLQNDPGLTSSTGEMTTVHAETEALSPSHAAEEVPSTDPGVASSTGDMAAVHAEMDPKVPSPVINQTILAADEGPSNVDPSQADLSERPDTDQLVESPLTAEAIHSASDSTHNLNLDRSSSAHGDTGSNSLRNDSGVTSSTGEMVAVHAEMETPSPRSLIAAGEGPSTDPGVTSGTGEMVDVHGAEIILEAPSPAIDQTIPADEGPSNVEPSQADLSKGPDTDQLVERPLTAEAIHRTWNFIDDLNLDQSSSAHSDTHSNSLQDDLLELQELLNFPRLVEELLKEDTRAVADMNSASPLIACPRFSGGMGTPPYRRSENTLRFMKENPIQFPEPPCSTSTLPPGQHEQSTSGPSAQPINSDGTSLRQWTALYSGQSKNPFSYSSNDVLRSTIIRKARRRDQMHSQTE